VTLSADAPQHDADALATCAAALAAARPLVALSAGFALVAALGIAGAGALAGDVAPALSAWTAALAAGLAAQWLGYRITLDAALFDRLAREATDARLDFARFDAAMLRLALMPRAKAGRDVAARCRGALGLVRALGVAVVVQAALIVLGGVVLASAAR